MWCLSGSSLASNDGSEGKWFMEGFACGVQRAGEVWSCIEMKRAYTDTAAGKSRVQIGTPHPDRSSPPLFDVGSVSAVCVG